MLVDTRPSQLATEPKVTVVRVQERRLGIVPWGRSKQLAVGEEIGITYLTDVPEDHGADLSYGKSYVRTTIASTARDSVEVIRTIQPWRDDFAVETSPREKITLEPGKPVTVNAGWGRRAKLTMV